MPLTSIEPQLTSAFSQFYTDIKEKSDAWPSHLLILFSLIGDRPLHIMLADDDEDDRELFKDAMHEVAPHVRITTVPDGVTMLRTLTEPAPQIPDIIFLDLNMPQKNGIECLLELRSSERLSHVPMVIYSTSANKVQIDQTYRSGANLYIQKPQHFEAIKNLLRKTLSLDPAEYLPQPDRSRFVVS